MPIYILSIIITIGILFFIRTNVSSHDQSANESFVEIGGRKIPVEVVDTAISRMRGLSGRENLPENTGMLFVFDKPGKYTFWMKDMKFAIDIIWIEDGRIVDIWENAQPPSQGEIPIYTPEYTSTYVLEVNAGFAKETGVKIGDGVILDISE